MLNVITEFIEKVEKALTGWEKVKEDHDLASLIEDGKTILEEEAKKHLK